jgi:hypothetical protein
MRSKKNLFWKSLKRALQLIAGLYLLILFSDIFVGDPTTPLLQRFPPAWILYWPKLFLSPRPKITDLDLIVSLSLDMVAFSVLIFLISWLLARRKSAPDEPDA